MSDAGIIINPSWGETSHIVKIVTTSGIITTITLFPALCKIVPRCLSYHTFRGSKILSLQERWLDSVFSTLPPLSWAKINFSSSVKVSSASGFGVKSFFSLLDLKKSAGVIVKEIKSEAKSVTKIVIGIYAKYFPITHGKLINGKNTTTVVAVPEINEFL